MALYATDSVILLLAHLVWEYRSDPAFLDGLGRICDELCSDYIHGKISRMNQEQLALIHVHQHLKGP
jgi:hypothetical protein